MNVLGDTLLKKTPGFLNDILNISDDLGLPTVILSKRAVGCSCSFAVAGRVPLRKNSSLALWDYLFSLAEVKKTPRNCTLYKKLRK